MRRNLSIIIAAAIVIAVLVGLSAASFVTLDRPDESESDPRRSTYNSGPTGSRALYQFLEESGVPVSRWRSGFENLATTSQADLMVMIGPFPPDDSPSSREHAALRKWVDAGGHLLVISRNPAMEFEDPSLRISWKVADEEWKKSAEQIADQKSDRLIVQPTVLTRGLKGIRLSTLASRIVIYRQPITDPGPQATPSPEVDPAAAAPIDTLWAPVVHLGDTGGAVLVDFDYGDGRIVLLSDPFVVANNGIGRGANLQLTMNLLNELRGDGGRVLIDETHHGFRETRNHWVNYFRGTPAKWLASQLVVVALLMAYTYGKRFTRPLPLPQVDRHSPLEFVGSMAHLQKLASARDLALENIYPPFRVEVCRSLGVSVRASVDEIVAALGRRQRNTDAAEIRVDELRRIIRECESAIVGVPIDDQELLELVGSMRKIREKLTKKASA